MRFSRVRALTGKALRVTVYLAVVAVGLGAVGAKAVEAKGQKAALAVGDALGSLEGVEGGGNVLTLNGQPLHLASAHLDAPVRDVLDRAYKGCQTHAAGLADDLAEIESSFGRAPAERGAPGIGVLKDVREGHGAVSCFAPDAPSGPVETMQRMTRFASSHDLADLGGLRYLTAHADEAGGTRVTATWADGHIDIGAMFPAEGDAPGEDPAAAPRPNGRRILSARVAPASYAAFLYASSEPADRAVATYEAALVARGFEVVQGKGAGRAYRRGLVDLMVTATETTDSPASSERTTLSVIESHFAQVHAQGTPAR